MLNYRFADVAFTSDTELPGQALTAILDVIQDKVCMLRDDRPTEILCKTYGPVTIISATFEHPHKELVFTWGY